MDAMQYEQSQRLYPAAAVRGFDHYAIHHCGLPGAELMRRAAAALWREARQRWPQAWRVAVLCGTGNNGGDGYEVARLARAAGCAVQVWQCGPAPASGDAAAARALWLADAGQITPFNAALPADLLSGCELVVDALFGTGLSRPLPEDAAAAVAAIAQARAAGAAVVAVDIPSGIAADTGERLGCAVQADLTVTFIANKLGLYLGAGPEHAGERVLDDLGVPAEVYAQAAPLLRLIGTPDQRRWLPRRARESHKGSNGHVLLIGGEHGTAGAILLAARGALRAGAGLVTVATRAAHAAQLTAAQPEVMFAGVESHDDLAPLLHRATVVAIGPGLGQGDWGRAMWSAVCAYPALVVDADALNLLAQQPRRNPGWILTPHPGEAARLLATTSAQVQAARLASVQALAARYDGVAVLKGAGSLVADATAAPPYLCAAGNPGMGTGGMGDVLSGVIAALRAQGLAPLEAAAAGVQVHAAAGDRAARDGERGLIPSDLLAALRGEVNPA